MKKLSDVLNNDIVKKHCSITLVSKVTGIEAKIFSTTGLDANDFVKKADYNTKITKIKNKVWTLVV